MARRAPKTLQVFAGAVHIAAAGENPALASGTCHKWFCRNTFRNRNVRRFRQRRPLHGDFRRVLASGSGRIGCRGLVAR